ncbi:MAG TPA: S8 family serine peptidase [Pyrinomonadaceae bacterium]|jgi:serine protease AprX|nr:S8 family serine peptidase [Pyrinomonadaceae bacterium]
MLDAINFQTNDHRHSHAQNRFAVIPTADKLNADLRFTGRGVCIAFLDSGFYPHTDFADRVIAFHDVGAEEKSFHSIREPKSWHWHGTQTVTACAGNGALSDGVYRGIASDAKLVLVKVSEGGGRISDESIEKGLLWILLNRQKYDIRVLNMSLGGDMDVSFAESRINQLAEELIKQGVSITVAAGNSSESHSIPPANSPSVITVGGYGDENQFSNEAFELYHSNFGTTIDGLVKPEIIAPAMLVAAPILPATEDYAVAETLSLLANAPDYAFRLLLDEYWQKAGLPDYIGFHGNDSARARIEEKLQERKVVATHYQHVDGTSFAAPITASVIAQMLEANPGLTPLAVKNILISTAQKLAGQPLIRQGYGVLNANLAVALAERETHFLKAENFAPPRIENSKIVFFYHDDRAASVYLVGDFNDWKKRETQFTKSADGVWRAAINGLKPGKYRYKFFVNDEVWTEDASHGLKEQDGFGGFHSILIVK